MLLVSALIRVLALIVANRGIFPVTALIDLMAEALGANRLRVSPGFLSQVGPLVAGPLPLRLIVLGLFLCWGLAPQVRPLLLLPPPSSDGGASSSSSEEGVPDCRDSPSVVSGVASCSNNVSSVASVCNSNVLDDNGLLIDKVSNGNSTNVMNSAIGNVSGDSPISSVNNVVSNTDNTNSSVSDGPDSGVPLVGLTDGVPSVSPPSSGDSEMTSLSAVRKRSAPKSPPEDPSAPPNLIRRPVAKAKKNPGGEGHHLFPANVSLAAEMASSRGRPLISVMAGFFSLIMALSLLTLNCNGIRDQSKRAGLVQWLRSLPVGADIVCLQETHCLSSAECSSWFFSSGFSAVVSPGSSHSCGCIVLFRPSLSLVNSWSDVSGRYLQVEFSLFGKSFRVVCVYTPNRNPARDQFFVEPHSRIDPSIPTVLCGL